MEARRERLMAYRLKAGESVPEGVRRIVSDEIEDAAVQLAGKKAKNRDEAIHEARKSVKKIRGILRLIQPELGGTYRRENARLQEIGRKLSEFRDAGAIIETFDDIRKKYRAELRNHNLASIRRGLVQRKKEAEEKAGIEKALGKIAATLRALGKDVKGWPLQTDGFPAIAPGLRNVFRRGRKTLAYARKHPRPENYHDLRKRVKDHWYHVRLLENLWTDVMKAYEASLKDLETWLGEDHNLVVLRAKILAEPDFYGSDKEIQRLLILIGKYEKELRDNSISLAERIYEVKPRAFTKRLEKLWHAWQTQPESMKEPERTIP